MVVSRMKNAASFQTRSGIFAFQNCKIGIKISKMSVKTATAQTLLNGYQTKLNVRQHEYLADDLLDDGGTDLGMRPTELLLGALATCKAMTIRFYARRQGWQLDTAEVHCEMQTERVEGKMITKIMSKIELSGDLTDEQRQRLLAVADKCPVHRILTGEIQFSSAV